MLNKWAKKFTKVVTINIIFKIQREAVAYSSPPWLKSPCPLPGYVNGSYAFIAEKFKLHINRTCKRLISVL